MATTRWSPHAVSINSSYFSGIKSYTMNGNTQKGIESHDGQVDPTFSCVLEQKPDITIRTVDINGLFQAVGFSGIAITELTVWWQRRQDAGTRASGTVHLKAVATKGMAVIRPLSVSHNQVVEAEVQIFLESSDGLTDPWTWTANQALAGTIQAVNHYTMGPVALNSVAVPATDWNFDPGINAEPSSTDGLPYADYIDIEDRVPKFDVTTPDVSKVTSLNMNGVIGPGIFYLRKLAEGGAGGRVPNATAEHIKFTIADGLITMDTLQGDHGSEASATISMDATYNGTNSIVAIDYASAIT